MEERNYKLYVHISPSNKRYYGITCQEKCEYRWNDGKGYRDNKHFTRAINKYGWDNFEHQVLFDNLTKEEAELLEQMYIELYDTTNPKYGYNRDLGGNAHSKATRKKLSEIAKEVCSDPEYRKRISDNAKQRWQNEEYRVNMSNKLKEVHANPNSVWNSDEYKDKQRAIAKEKWADPEYRNKCINSIQNIKRTDQYKNKQSNRMKTLHADPNSVWNSDEFHKKFINVCREKNGKEVVMIDKDTGQIIRKFNSIAQAKEYLGETNNKIYRCVNGQCKTAYGYCWCYLDNLDTYELPQFNENKEHWTKTKTQEEINEWKRKLSEYNKGKYIGENSPMYGKHHTEETKRKIGQAMKGNNNPNAKAVLMFTKEGEFIRRFDCVGDANEYLGKKRHNATIYQCAKDNLGRTHNNYRKAHGYIWKYEDQEQQEAI